MKYKVGANTLVEGRYFIVTLAIFVVLSAFFITIFPKKAEAAIWPSNTLYRYVMPSGNFDTLYHCDEPAWNPSLWSPSFTQWISPSGRPTMLSMTVPSGTTSVSLDINFNGATCVQSNGSVDYTNTRVVNSYTTGISGVVGQNLALDFTPGDVVGTYKSDKKTFTYAPTGGFTSTALHTITLGTKTINEFPASPNFRCVHSGANLITASNISDFASCPENRPQFSIWIIVTPPPPPPSIWNYIHNSFTTSPNSAASTTPSTSFRYRPGRNITVNNQIRNNGAGEGRSYTHQIRVSQNGGATWPSGINPIMDRSETEIGGGSDKIQRSVNYTLPTSGVANDSVICFQGRISPFRGQSSPTSTITSSGWRESGVRCVRVYNKPPTIVTSGTNATCNRVNYQINDPDGDRHDATLQISNGSGGWTDISSRSNRPNESNYFNISSYRGFNTRTFRLVISDRGPLGETVTRNFNIGPCATAPCSSINIKTNPSSPEPGDTFSVDVGISVSGGIGSNGTPASYSATLSGISGVNGTPQTVGPTTINAGDSTSSVTFSGLSSANPVNMPMTITVSGLRSVAFPCGGTLRITNQPYLSIYGNDVLAGGGFGAGCVSTDGEIKARLRGDNAGAGSQMAVFALGEVTGFASAKLRDSGTPSRPNGLTFANTSDPPGNFGGTNCITGYEMPSDPTDNFPPGDLSSFISGKYYKIGDLTAASSSGNNINATKHIKIYVYGDLTIGHNIEYNNTSSWSDIDEVPSLTFVVKGNIYIDSNVTRLDGTYVARPKDDGSAGTIYTCTDGSTTYTIDQLYNNCGGATNDKQLIVYGSFIANNIKWLRTFNTLKNANPSEHPNSPGNTNCDNKPICAAEVIISGPEMYINNRTKFIGGGNNTNVYDSITNMPPVL